MEDTAFFKSLIDTVRQFEAIYNKKHPNYCNKIIRDKHWEEIQQITGKPKIECKRRWRLLRERFSKETRKRNDNYCSSSKTSDWPFYEQMSYLKDYLSPRSIQCHDFVETIYGNQIHFEERAENCSYDFSNPIQVADEETKEAKKRKLELDNVCCKLVDTLNKFQDTISISQQSLKHADDCGDEIFMQNIACLMKSLPEKAKDDLKRDIFNRVMNLRSTHLHSETNNL